MIGNLLSCPWPFDRDTTFIATHQAVEDREMGLYSPVLLIKMKTGMLFKG